MANIKQCDKCGKIMKPQHDFFYNCKIQFVRNAAVLDNHRGEKEIDLCPTCFNNFRGFLGLDPAPDVGKKENVSDEGAEARAAAVEDFIKRFTAKLYTIPQHHFSLLAVEVECEKVKKEMEEGVKNGG